MSQSSRANLDHANSMFTMVSEVLYWIWDPIGVNYTFDARDEYDTYAWQVVRILLEDIDSSAKELKIESYLTITSQQTIGVGSNLKQSRETVERLMDILDFDFKPIAKQD